jgi:hypothetical protein
VTFAGAALIWKIVGLRVEYARLRGNGSRISAEGLRFGLTARR